MSATPAYKFLKSNGTSFYAFPGASNDISSAYQNQNYKMYFSKFVLLNLPQSGVDSTTGIDYWDFSGANGPYGFNISNVATPATNYSDQLVESLRNYVANFEVTMKDSMLNNTDFYYDNTVLDTPTEKIFWKWAKQLNLIDFELANQGDQYFPNLPEFASNNSNDVTYFPEYLWQERQTTAYKIKKFYDASGYLALEMEVPSNFRSPDPIYSRRDTIILNGIESYPVLNGTYSQVTNVIPAVGSTGQLIVTTVLTADIPTFTSPTLETTGTASLVYHKLVQYIGEVSGVNNVNQSNRSYTEVYAHIPASTGQTPDILFRTKYDNNYKPNLEFPILPSQFQEEIKGAELFNSPIVSNPTNYPGSYYAQYDTQNTTYQTGQGDYLRRSGNYYGINGDTNTSVVNGNTVDGIGLDFDSSHYVKMNIIGQEVTNFDSFNSMMINNQFPKDFEFNAILWYYTVEDINGNKTDNLYGVSFVDNPNNNPIESEMGIRVPTFRKLAVTDFQDGVSYAFSLNLSFNIINENPQDTYNPQAINNLFSMNLFNQAMNRLASVNDSFLKIISSQGSLENDIFNMKQLLYSQTDFNVINKRIDNLDNLLKLYSTNQIIDSDSIQVTINNSTKPPLLSFQNIDPTYKTIYDITTSSLWNASGVIPFSAVVPTNKNFLISILNDDKTQTTLPNNDKLKVVLSRDLYYKQSCDIIIESNTTSTQNKQLEIYVYYQTGTNAPVMTKLVSAIDLPVYYNTVTQKTNTAYNWSSNNFSIDITQPIQLNTGNILSVPISSNGNLVYNAFNSGDTFQLSNFTVGTGSQIDFSSQYKVSSVGSTNSYVYFDVSNNPTIVNYGMSASLPITFNSSTSYVLSNSPFLKLNKGIKIRITRVSEANDSSLFDRYLIEKTWL
jgi:hypothetical protein